MPILEAFDSFDFGDCSASGGTSYVLTAVSYVPQPGESNWRYIFLASGRDGGQKAYHCLIPHAAGLTWEDADYAISTDVLKHVQALLANSQPCRTMTSGVGNYTLVPMNPSGLANPPVPRENVPHPPASYASQLSLGMK